MQLALDARRGESVDLYAGDDIVGADAGELGIRRVGVVPLVHAVATKSQKPACYRSWFRCGRSSNFGVALGFYSGPGTDGHRVKGTPR